MGYSASRLSGDPIRIPRENTAKFLELIEPKEERIGHISWCQTVSEYRTELKNNTDDITITLLEDYGFIPDSDADSIILLSWGGDKIGSSWDDVWEVLAQVVDPSITYEWVMMGEDEHMWGERMHLGVNTKHDVIVQVAN